MSQKYLVIIEQGTQYLSAFSPDLPGCVATGDIRQQLMERMRAAILMHLEAMREVGLPILVPAAVAETIEA